MALQLPEPNVALSHVIEPQPARPQIATDAAMVYGEELELSRQTGTRTAPIPRSISSRLYLSHFLSTWNSRSFEFGAVLFLAVIYPNTLLTLSIYALIRSASAILFATPIGHAIDHLNRLSVVRFSIVAGRLAVMVSCFGFWALYHYNTLLMPSRSGILAILILLSCLEKVASVLNLVAVERDWVVVIAEKNENNLRKVNARMRRIDLVCKLLGPLFIALVDGASTTVAVFVLLGINAISLPIEYITIARVYKTYPDLQTREIVSADVPARTTIFPREPLYKLLWCQLKTLYTNYHFYFKHRACLPSFALALLYFTVLSFGGQMVTYLVAAGFNSFYVGLVRSLSVVFEITATWIGPTMMRKLGAPRAGMWCLSWQIIWLAATVSFFWGESSMIVVASGLSAGTIVSRIGLWGYDLCAQAIIQMEVRENHRGEFSSVEASFQNLFELLSYVLTIICSRPDQFKYPVLISAAAVFSSGSLYAYFLRQRRGHLMHIPCVKSDVHGVL